MDFSTLLSSGSLLYVGLGVVVLLIIVLLYKLFFGKKESAAAPSLATQSAAASVTTETQAVTQSAEVLPSTEVINQMPVVETTPTLPVAEAPKAEVPPLSSWKPSQEAAPIPAKDDVVAVGAPVSESVAEKPAQ